jgi:hypothetical protein
MVAYMRLRINWVGLAGGIAIIMVVVLSLFYPWWQLKVGDGLVTANASPLNTNFDVLGTSVSVPLLWAVNMAGLLTFVVSGVAMIIYSLMPRKPYSKTLLGFAYKKPLYAVVAFVVFLFASTSIAQTVLQFNLPLAGSTTSSFPIPLVQGATVSVFVSAGFQLPFWLAIVSAGLCVGARIYHKRVASVQPEDVILEVATPIAPSATVESAE